MKNLPYPDNRHLEAAEGWLELGNDLEANKELEQITPELRNHPFVLELRYKIYSKAGKWEMAAEVAGAMYQMLPENYWGPFYLAYALHELKRTQQAYDTLIAVVDKFPKEWLMMFNLACYSCQLQKLEESMQWLERAIDVAGKRNIRQQALDDPDLEPLWTQIREI